MKPTARRLSIAFAAGILIVPVVFSAVRAFTSFSEKIRVALADNQHTVLVQARSGLIVEGTVSLRKATRMVFGPGDLSGGLVRIRAVGNRIKVNGKIYHGRIELRKNKNGLLLLINELDLEDYLRGVVASEVPRGWKFEALKAQAVASRTYALYQKRTAGRRAYDIRSTEDSQVYAGISGERTEGVEAVKATKGMVLEYQGAIIPAFYHSSCGGHTEDAAVLWGIDVPYLKGVDCDCQEISRYGLWEKRISLKQVERALRHLGFRMSTIQDMKIEEITPAGRVKELAVRSPNGNIFVSAESLRAALGNSVLPSVFFELELDGSEAVFSGRGRGHGVGLCQWGAEQMAEQGYDFATILSHYYPGTTLVRLK